MATDDRDIVVAMRNDSEAGFRLLMDRYKEAIYWHIRRLVVSHADAQDALQETFVRIFRSFTRFDEKHSFIAWIYRIATNEALRMLNRRKEGQSSIEEEKIHAGSVMADEYVDYSNLETVKLQNAILSLPTKQQLAFNLRYYDELTYDEIAEATDSSAANVKANYHIAKDKIIAYMNSHD